jgi:23S rRNA-intervening sequence protein
MKDFKDLRVWSEAHELTIALYRITREFPKEELFGLTSQMRRAGGFDRREHCRRQRTQIRW